MAMLNRACVSWPELMATREWRDAILPQIDYGDHAWPRLKAEGTPSGERAWLLSELIGDLPAEAEALTPFVLEQLCDHALDAQPHDFLEILIYAVQELDFFDENQREVALNGVWRITELLAKTQEMPKPVGLWAGIRVFASLATEADIPRIAKFLGDEFRRETQQAALRAIYLHAFHLAPPRQRRHFKDAYCDWWTPTCVRT